MKGDILIISGQHRNAAEDVIRLALDDVRLKDGKFFFTVAGESGAGKSEIASAMKELLVKQGFSTFIIQQDDYFLLPPKTNEKARVIDINRVGPQEVNLDLLNLNIKNISEGKPGIIKPLVIFEEDRITTETIHFDPFKVVIIDGTYTTLLEGIDCHIFIDRDRNDTREDRQKRNREKQNEYLENILEIEHHIISRHKEMADIIINKEFKAFRAK